MISTAEEKRKKDTEKLYFQAFNSIIRCLEAALHIFKAILSVLQLVDRPIWVLQS